MGKKYRNLFDKIANKDALWAAYRKASKGKKNSSGYLGSRLDAGAMIDRLYTELINGTYRPGQTRQFIIYEPKPRQIDALPFRDRVVQHALHAVIEPIFDKVFLPNSFACRHGKGAHKGVKLLQAELRRMNKAGPVWVLKTDFSKYFHSVPGAAINKEIRRKISCRKTLALIEMYHPPSVTGIRIGWLTSQLMANVCGHILDRQLTHVFRVRHWWRYMDDVVILARSREFLVLLQHLLTDFVKHYMGMGWSKWSISRSTQGINFLGYRIWHDHKLIRKDSVRRAKRKIVNFIKFNEPEELTKFLASWMGHIQWADTQNLLVYLESQYALLLQSRNPRANHRHSACLYSEYTAFLDRAAA